MVMWTLKVNYMQEVHLNYIYHSKIMETIQKIKILLAEDDENLGTLLREYLNVKSYDADWFINGEKAYKSFIKGHYDLCILDVMMPVKDGYTLAREIRMTNTDIPIIFLTAKSLKEDIIEGFKAGADDYISKPFSMEELLFRVEAVIRRTKERCSRSSPDRIPDRELFVLSEYAVVEIGQYRAEAYNQGIGPAKTSVC